jgi:hypothetical protein
MSKNSDNLQYDENGNVIGNTNHNRLAILQAINDSLDGERESELTDIVNLDRGETEPFKASPINNDGDEDDEQQGQGQEDDQGDGRADGQAQREQDAARQSLEEHERREAETALQGQEVKHTIRVNGRDIQLTTAELIARASKVEAADAYLAEAKRQAEEATPKQPQPSHEDVAAAEEEGLKRIARALQVGSEEEAVAAVRALLERGPSPDDLARTVDTRLTLAEANKKFAETYSHITSDPVTYNLARQRYAELVQSGVNKPIWEVFDQVGREISGWMESRGMQTKKAEQPPAPKVEVTQERVARKQDAPKNPKSATQAANVTETEEQEPSVQDVIAEIAKARGGPQWMAGRQPQ